MAKALAAKWVVQLAIEMSFLRVMVEGDCKRVVQALQAPGRSLMLYGHVIEHARRLGATLETCSFHHVFREGNLLAHSLACRAVLTADTKGVNTVPEAIPIWLAVRYISDTDQYRCTVSGLPLFFIYIYKYLYIYIYIYICMCVCVCVCVCVYLI